jgi:hypothetical protein
VNQKTILTITGFIIVAVTGTGFLAWDSLFGQKRQEHPQSRIIIPQEINGETDSASADRMAWEDSVNTKVALGEGEVIVAILSQDFDGDPAEEQVVAYRNLLEMESSVFITYIDFDEPHREYRRVWTASTAASRPGTISLFTADLIGDRGFCIILTGMNSQDEHTMTVFRRMVPADSGQSFPKIAEIKIDGSISIQETERSQAYHQGITGDKSFTIAAYSHDSGSGNILDQMEIIYAFVPENGRYEETKRTRIPGSQIEQRRLRELLSGEKGVFENFISDLWYYVGPQGTLDSRQYIYFDPAGREIIFFGDNTQQVFTWQNSNPTRYGLYISSQNISITTLRRFLDIELASLDSIRIKVFEDVRLKIALSASWDGSYRRAGTVPRNAGNGEKTIRPPIDALYDSSLGRLRFYPSGEYELSSGGALQKGRYVFFQVNGQELLEFRPEGTGSRNGTAAQLSASTAINNNSAGTRTVYLLDKARNGDDAAGDIPGSLNLSRVRLGATGIQDLHEGAILLTAVQE